MATRPKKKQLPSRTTLRKILSEAAFDPREEGTPLNVIATTAGRNYHTNRALEMIREASDALELNGEASTFHEKMRMAMGLLALAVAEAPPVPAEAT